MIMEFKDIFGVKYKFDAKGSWVEFDTSIHWCDLADIDRLIHPKIQEHWHTTFKKDLEVVIDPPLGPISEDPEFFNPWA